MGFRGQFAQQQSETTRWAIRTDPRNPHLRMTVWWAREDSNLQPSDYHPLALNIEQRAACGDFVASECPRWWSYVYDRFEELLPKL